MLLLSAQVKWLTVHLLKMQIKTKDEVVRRVLAKMDERSLVGQEVFSRCAGRTNGCVALY